MKWYDENMRLSDEIGMYITVSEMVCLTIFMVGLLVYAIKKKLYAFMKVLIILCIFANIGTALISVGVALETDNTYHV